MSRDGSGRKRANSHAVLERYDRLLSRTILVYQDPVTGLLPAFVAQDGSVGGEFAGHAWVRDNVYCALAMWGMALAHKRRADSEEERQRGEELEKSVVKLMRSILQCLLRQADRVETFKKTLKTDSALHAKFSMSSCSTVVGDHGWGHLQIDATSLFLLILAQLTTSGLQIVYNMDEVTFIQNLVFYIEEAYRIPDYGIWERGDKTNHGQTELNASSIGMAKAALEAMSGLDLFGARGGPGSVVYVLSDQVAQCNTKLTSLLPRESSSKEIDAALLFIIGFPAFAVENSDLIQLTKDKIINKLLGTYGCKRFQRDGYHTAREDSSRLHYDPAELKVFENIECEWPVFLALLLIDSKIKGEQAYINHYNKLLERVMLVARDGLERMPELYYVPGSKVEAEYQKPHSQPRLPGKKSLCIWAQAIYILAQLLSEGLLNIGEIDPLNRRQSTVPKPDPVVQVVLLAEDLELANELRAHEIVTQTIPGIEKDRHRPVRVYPAKILSEILQQLGVNKKMKLSGRPVDRNIGALSTSSLYAYRGKMFAFTPTFVDHETFYLSLDNELLVDLINTDLAYLKSNWRLMGCPTLTLPIMRAMLGDKSTWAKSPMFRLLLSLHSGYTAGVRVQLGTLADFISTSCVVRLFFADLSLYTDRPLSKSSATSMVIVDEKDSGRRRMSSGTSSVAGFVKKSRSAKFFDKPTSTSPLLSPSLSPSLSSPSLPHLAVAKGWSARRHSIGFAKHLQDSQMNLADIQDSRRKEASSMANTDIQELLRELQTTTSILDQADILHFLYSKHGLEYDTNIGNQKCTVGMLMEELYEKVGSYRIWSLVRHSAGILKKIVEDLSQASTDLLVRQKHFSVGQPHNEIHITQPLPPHELLEDIWQACCGDPTAVALTQEILVYLAMFIRAEPHLFNEMLRLRIGLILNVMVTELSQTLHCSYEDAMEHLVDLGPFTVKSILHHIFSRKEFRLDTAPQDQNATRQLSIVTPSKKYASGQLHEHVQFLGSSNISNELDLDDPDRHGQWRRRRRLDGALNRVPQDFYPQLWYLLSQCHGLSIGSKHLPRIPTINEMTAGELKFALRVESVLNSLPDPEYRQLVVEVLMVCATLAAINPKQHLPGVIVVDEIIQIANSLFLKGQAENDGLAQSCCCQFVGKCERYARVCIHFYDSAPSGVYGTMSYFTEAVISKLTQMLGATQQCQVS